MPYVSDHAIVRHLERVYGLDVEAIRAEIASPVVHLAEGTRVKIVDCCVTTVLPKRRR